MIGYIAYNRLDHENYGCNQTDLCTRFLHKTYYWHDENRKQRIANSNKKLFLKNRLRYVDLYISFRNTVTKTLVMCHNIAQQFEKQLNTRKLSFLRFQNISKLVKNFGLRLAISTPLRVWKSEEFLPLVFLRLRNNYYTKHAFKYQNFDLAIATSKVFTVSNVFLPRSSYACQVNVFTDPICPEMR